MMNETIKSVTSELEILQEEFKEVIDSPWSMYNNLTWPNIVKFYNENSFEETKEVINRSDIRTYRTEEAFCGNI